MLLLKKNNKKFSFCTMGVTESSHCSAEVSVCLCVDGIGKIARSAGEKKVICVQL